jgi:hypothetical protein
MLLPVALVASDEVCVAVLAIVALIPGELDAAGCKYRGPSGKPKMSRKSRRSGLLTGMDYSP